jgi:succinyl-CoA synthetase beta subunit
MDIKKQEKKTPMIVVLRGTNSDEAKTILQNSDLDITFASDLPDAANKIRQKLGN